MLPTELLFAFLNDVYVVSNPDRTRPLYDLLGEKLAHAGIRLHAGKTRMWNKASERPPNIDDQKGSRYWGPQWVQTRSCCEQRHPVRRKRSDCGRPCHAWVPDAQCAWQILSAHVSPLPQNRPPRQSTGYADGHDDGMWKAVEGVQWQSEMARWLTSLPMRLGGLGIRSQDGACFFFFEFEVPFLTAVLGIIVQSILQHMKRRETTDQATPQVVKRHCTVDTTRTKVRRNR